MIIVKGKGIGKGIAAGTISFMSDSKPKIPKNFSADTEYEKYRFKRARADAANQLQSLYEKALNEIGETDAKIFSIHQMLLEDQDFIDDICTLIDSEKVCAEYAVSQVSDDFFNMFSAMENEYMRSRCADIMDISDRVIRILCNKKPRRLSCEKNLIICADDLSPSETLLINKDSVIAFVTRNGSSTSHTSILAKKMSIPAIVGVGDDLLSSYHGRAAVVNASKGEVIIYPNVVSVKRLTQEAV